MDDETSPGLGIGFAIHAGGSFDTLLRLQEMSNSTEAKVAVDAARIKKATSGMVQLGGASAIVSYDNSLRKFIITNAFRDLLPA